MTFQRYLTDNVYVFYKVANSKKFVRPHSYDCVRFLWQLSLGAGLGVVLHAKSYKFAPL